MTDQQNAIHRMRRRALDINRAFRKMRPLFVRARRLSLNAEVTSSVVGDSGTGLIVVMRELRSMTLYLRNMIADIEKVSGRIATRMATSMSAESKQRYYRQTLDLMREDQGKAALRWPDSFLGSGPRPVDMSPTESLLWTALNRADNEISEGLTALASIAQELLVQLHRSSWVAVRQSEYLAVLAAVEASRWTDRKDSVDTIVESMRDISESLRNIQQEAGDQVNGLIFEVNKVRGPSETANRSIAA